MIWKLEAMWVCRTEISSGGPYFGGSFTVQPSATLSTKLGLSFDHFLLLTKKLRLKCANSATGVYQSPVVSLGSFLHSGSVLKKVGVLCRCLTGFRDWRAKTPPAKLIRKRMPKARNIGKKIRMLKVRWDKARRQVNSRKMHHIHLPAVSIFGALHILLARKPSRQQRFYKSSSKGVIITYQNI